MSLKNVHTIFIAAAVALSAWCSVLAFTAFRSDGTVTMAGAGLGAVGVALALTRYELRFLRRCRAEGIR